MVHPGFGRRWGKNRNADVRSIGQWLTHDQRWECDNHDLSQNPIGPSETLISRFRATLFLSATAPARLPLTQGGWRRSAIGIDDDGAVYVIVVARENKPYEFMRRLQSQELRSDVLNLDGGLIGLSRPQEHILRQPGAQPSIIVFRELL